MHQRVSAWAHADSCCLFGQQQMWAYNESQPGDMFSKLFSDQLQLFNWQIGNLQAPVVYACKFD